MQRSMERTILSGYLAGFVLLCLVGFVSIRSIHTLINDAGLVAHTYQTLQAVDTVIERLDDVGTEGRTYADDPSAQTASEYRTFRNTITANLDHLRPLVADHPDQQQNLADFSAHFNLADRQTEAIFALPDPPAEARNTLRQVWSAAQVKMMSDIVKQIDADQRQFLVERNTIARQSANQAFLTIMVAILCAFVIVGTSAYLALRDLRARRRAEQQLASARAEADAANQAKSAFLANMSHEIRTPMTAILGYADQLLAHDLTAEQRAAHVATVRRNGQHLLAIINDILDLSKIEAGRMTIEHLDLPIRELIADLQSLMNPRAAERGIPLRFEFLSPVPETINTDPTRLRQILLNLIGNALKFTDRGSVRVALAADLQSTPPVLNIDVIDTGIGMTEAQIAQLFKPFSQADATTSRRFGGTGLGLNISQRLAAALGGVITVESSPKAGSRFRVSLRLEEPLAKLISPAALAAAAPPVERPATPSTLSASVLIAEDGPDNRELFSTILARAGCRISLASDGREAMDRALAAAASKTPFDLILMDMQMPVMDGYEATSNLRSRGYGGPIVALTAHAMEGDRQRSLHAGCTEYAAKPIDAEDLLQLVARFAPNSPAPEPSIRELVPPELAAKFRIALPRRIAALEAAFAANDRVTVGRLAHQLAGAAGAYGHDAIAAEAVALERATTQGNADAETLRPHLERLQALSRQVA